MKLTNIFLITDRYKCVIRLMYLNIQFPKVYLDGELYRIKPSDLKTT